jgi:AcrR family transcriptional regulator
VTTSRAAAGEWAEAFADRGVRREGDVERPLGPRAQKTRTGILAAAAERFGAAGYQATSMADVATAAGVSLGTVYQYFRDRGDLVAALLQRGVTSMVARSDTTWRVAEGYDGLYRVLHNFVMAYTESARLSGVWEEVAHVDDDLAALRRALGRIFTGAVERELKRATRAGMVRADVDPALAARALTAMADRYCYVTYVFDPPDGGPPPPDTSADVLARLWAGAVGLVAK